MLPTEAFSIAAVRADLFLAGVTLGLIARENELTCPAAHGLVLQTPLLESGYSLVT